MINWVGISKMDFEKTYVIVIDKDGMDNEIKCCIMSNGVLITTMDGKAYTTNIVQLASVLKYVKGVVVG